MPTTTSAASETAAARQVAPACVPIGKKACTEQPSLLLPAAPYSPVPIEPVLPETGASPSEVERDATSARVGPPTRMGVPRPRPPVTPPCEGLQKGELDTEPATPRKPRGINAPVRARVRGRLVAVPRALVLVTVGRDTEATVVPPQHPSSHALPSARPRRQTPVITTRDAELVTRVMPLRRPVAMAPTPARVRQVREPRSLPSARPGSYRARP